MSLPSGEGRSISGERGTEVSAARATRPSGGRASEQTWDSRRLRLYPAAGGADREGGHVLRVKHVQPPTPDEPRQAGGRDAAEHDRGPTDALFTPPPTGSSDCTQPGGGNRREPIVGRRDEALERAGVDEPRQTDDRIPQQGRERLTQDSRQPKDPLAAERERQERQDAE